MGQLWFQEYFKQTPVLALTLFLTVLAWRNVYFCHVQNGQQNVSFILGSWCLRSLTHQLDVRQSQCATVGDRTFATAGARLWNSLPRTLPHVIHSCISIENSKHLFRQSYISCMSASRSVQLSETEPLPLEQFATRHFCMWHTLTVLPKTQNISF